MKSVPSDGLQNSRTVGVSPTQELPGKHTPARVIGAVCGLTLLGLLLRLYHLDSQSAWADESCYFWLGVPNLRTYMSFISFCGPDNVPLYYLMLYGWSRLFGLSLIAARMMTILFGVGAIPVTFAVSRRIFDTRAGLLAALLVAISPFQIWFAQSVRPYGICLMLVFFGCYALMRARDGNRWGWPAVFAVNMALVWMHPFMALVIPAQVLYVLGTRPNGLRTAVYWSLAQLAVVVPPYLWLRPRMSNVSLPEFDHFTLPGPWKILVDALGDDATMFSSEFPVAPPDWAHRIPHFESWSLVACVSLMALLALLALSGLPRAVREWREGRSGTVMLWGIAFLPLMVLVTLSYVWRPCVETRHTAYASVAVLMLAAGAATSISRPYLRRLAVLATVGVLGLHSAVHLQSVTRTEWLAAARHIAAHQTSRDIILVKGIMHWAWVEFRANQDAQTIPVIPAYTIESVIHKTRAFFNKAEHTNDGSQVWAAIEMPFMNEVTLQRQFQECLGRSGISGSYAYYPGMERLLLCRFSRTGAGLAGDESGEPCFSVALTDYEGIADKLGMGAAGSEERCRAVRALRQVVDIPLLPFGDWQCTLVSLLLAESCEYAVAEPFARYAMEVAPDYANGHLALGVALAGQGQVDAALAVFGKTFTLDPVLESLYGKLIRSLYESPDETAASAELARIADTGFPFLAFRRLFVLRFPDGEAADPGRTSQDPLIPARCDNREINGTFVP